MGNKVKDIKIQLHLVDLGEVKEETKVSVSTGKFEILVDGK